MCPAANDRKRGSEDRAGEEGDDGIQAEPAKVAKLLDPAAVDTGKTSDSLLTALRLIHEGTKEGVAIAKARLHTVNESYFCGVKIGQDPRVLEEISALSESTDALILLAGEIGLKVNGAPCYKLPAEVMYDVFKYMDMESLAQCRDTCVRWRNLLDEEAAQRQSYKDTPVILHGTVAEIEGKWKVYRTLCQSPSSMSLKMVEDLRIGRPLQYEQVKNLVQNLKIPLEGLKTFFFEKHHDFGHEEVWNRILQCRALQTLHWSYHGDSERSFYYGSFSSRPEVLPPCGPEEIKFDVACDLIVNKEVLMQLCRRLRRFYHVQGLERERFIYLLKAAQWTLEELVVVKLAPQFRRDYYHDPIPLPKFPYYMARLKKVCIQDQNVLVLSITAPNATLVRFDHGDIIDWKLIDSCRGNLQSLHIETRGIKTKGRLAQEIFDMPQLEELHLDYKRGPYLDMGEDYKGRVTSHALYSPAAFWQAVCSNDISQVTNILPKLKKLTIIHDPLLDETAIIRYVSLRALAGQPKIEEIDVLLANHCSQNIEALEALSFYDSSLHYEKYMDWKAQDTLPWSLMDKIIMNDIFVKWDLIDACWVILKSLHIHLNDMEVNKRIKIELFNLPHLEDLKLDFSRAGDSEKGGWGATALWKAVSTGLTGNDKIDFQDILPRIKVLAVINDATLDQKKIVNMVAIRKQYGLPPIESIDITLTKRFFSDCARLDELKKCHTGFSYQCFTEWGHYLRLAGRQDV